MRKVILEGGPADRGLRHGSDLGPGIRAYLADRLRLAGDPFWAGRPETGERILEMAGATLDSHRRFSESLYAEMAAMASAAGITPAEAVVVGGFTDIVDMVRSAVAIGAVEDDCTGVIDAGAGTIAQTWDMHASAGEHVYLFDLRPQGAPRALIQTTAGCLGQIGMNEAGIAVGINNLTARGRVGVTWPFVVRKALEQAKLEDAIEVVVEAPVAGGHNFMLMGPDGSGCNVEAMPGERIVTRVKSGSFVHTNHCLAPETRAEEGERGPVNQESSLTRLARGRELVDDLDGLFADPAINRGAASEHDVATCGAVRMRPGALVVDAVWGRPGEHPWESFGFD